MPISCSVKRALEISEWTGWQPDCVGAQAVGCQGSTVYLPGERQGIGAILNYRKHHWCRRPPGPRALDQIQCEVTDTSISLPGLVVFLPTGPLANRGADMETLFTLFIVASVALLLYALARSDLVGTRSDIAGAAGIKRYPKPHYPGGAPG